MDPLSHVDAIDSKKHIILVFDDEKASRDIEFRFIKNGLDKEEYCVHMTYGEEKLIEYEMIKYGINV